VNDSAVTVTGVLDNTSSNGFFSTSGNQIIDANGNTVRITGINWFGFETNNKVVHGLWTRGYTSILDQVKSLGFNTLRVPFSNEMLRSDAVTSSINFAQNPDLQGLTPIQCLDKIVEYCGKIGLKVILDRHSAKADGYLNEDVWYIPNDSYYTEQRWINDWSMLAKRYANNSTVIGADLFNEPKNSATWGNNSPGTDWNKAAERCGNAILASNPNWLIIVEGVEKFNNETTWWGGNLKGAAYFPVNLSVSNKLVYSAHEYPSSVYAQKWFSDPSYPNNLDEVWNANFGYLFQNQTAPIFIGEFGTKLGSTSDQIWLDKFTDYMDGDLNIDGTKDLSANQKGMSWTYWSLNPNSGDTGGILNDDWTTVNTSKMAYIKSSLAPMLGTATGSSQTMNFQVKLSAASTGTVTVKFATANDTAVAGINYLAASGTLTFAPGETIKTVSIVIPSQNLTASKSFNLLLSTPTGATLADAIGVGTIQLANSPAPTPTPTPTPINHAPVANADTVYVAAGSAVTVSVLANDSDPDGDKLVVKSVTNGAFGTAVLQTDGTILYTPGPNFTGSDSFSYTAADPAGLTSNASVQVLKVSEGVKAWPAQVFAPYVDTTLWPTYDLVKTAKDQGLRYFSLAFITASPTNQPAWGGYSAYEMNGGEFDLKMRSMISGVRALGGDVNVSFGGANGHELAEVITDKAALKAAYLKVIDTYGLTRIDFDIEGAAVNNKAALDRRSAVLAELQADAAKAGKSLEIWLTLPVLPTGLTPDGVYAVQSAVHAGVKLGGVNIMAMDYGEWAAPNPNGKMGDYAIQSANSLHSQLKSIFVGYSDAKIWSMVGITPMIGMNDVTTEVFDQQEAREVLAFAQEKSIGKLSFWSLNRDMQNASGKIGYVDTTSSSILQSPFEFSSIFKVFTSQSNVNPVNPSPTPTPFPIPTISVANVAALEGNSGTTILKMDFTLSAASSSMVSVNYMTEDASAQMGVDYAFAQGTISFAAGETSKSLYLSIVGDTQVETNETFSVLLAGATGATLVSSFATATITNDDVNSVPKPTPSPVDPAGDKKVVAYFTEWGIYGRDYEVSDLPADKLTHVNYAFAKITDQGEVGIFDSWAAVEKPFGNDTWETPLRGNYHALQVLKQQHPHLQTLISVGGWTLSDKFSDVALTAESRAKFAKSAVDFIKKYGFDGVDLDWEYPVSGGLSSNVYRPEDGANYVQLVKEVRRQLEVAGATDSRHYLLTIAAPAGYDKYNNFQLAAMEPSLDWFNVMTYDYHGTWENQTNHQAALFANPNDPSGVGTQYNVDFTIQAYMDAGVPTGKIVMGAPIYGRGWSGVANVNHGLFQNATGAASGTWEKGTFDYSDLLNKVKTQPEVYKVYWDTQADTPFIYAPTVEGGMFSTFENPEMIAKRVDYIFANQLGGMMFWEASGDVRDSNSPDSLIGTAAKLLNGVGV